MKTSWLRWAGSKRRALSALQSVLESREYDFYVDPFVGTGAVFFELAKPVQAILSDSNRDLISFYRFLQQDPDAIWGELARFPRRITKGRYDTIREKFNSLPDSLERAATFFFLNRTCFNGIYRVNQRGEFNVPIGSRKKFNYPSLQVFKQVSEKLQRAKILDCDFAQTSGYASDLPGTNRSRLYVMIWAWKGAGHGKEETHGGGNHPAFANR